MNPITPKSPRATMDLPRAALFTQLYDRARWLGATEIRISTRACDDGGTHVTVTDNRPRLPLETNREPKRHPPLETLLKELTWVEDPALLDLRFELPECRDRVRETVANTAGYFDRDVRLDGNAVERRSIAPAGAVSLIEAGTTYYVSRHEIGSVEKGIVRINGMLMEADLPVARTSTHVVVVNVDVTDPHTGFVRENPEENAVRAGGAREILRSNAEHQLYRALAEMETPEGCPTAVIDRAREMRVEMKPRRGALRRWSPGRTGGVRTAPDPERGMLIDLRNDDPAIGASLARALAVNNLEEHAFTPEPMFQGQTWYDELRRITHVRAMAEDGDDDSIELPATDVKASIGTYAEYRNVPLELWLEDEDGLVADTLSTDLWIAVDRSADAECDRPVDSAELDEAVMLFTGPSPALTSSRLGTILNEALFGSTDRGGAGKRDDARRRNARITAAHLATSTLRNRRAADMEMLLEIGPVEFAEHVGDNGSRRGFREISWSKKGDRITARLVYPETKRAVSGTKVTGTLDRPHCLGPAFILTNEHPIQLMEETGIPTGTRVEARFADGDVLEVRPAERRRDGEAAGT